MDKLVYLVYPALLIFLLWGSKFYGPKKWNDDFMSLSQTKAIQGFTAVIIMLHHLGQKTCAPWLQQRYIVHGLDVFVPIGYICVGLFLFCSGYGLLKSYMKKPDYLKGFFSRRVLPIILAYYSTGLLFFVLRMVMGQKMGTEQIIGYLTGLKLSNPNGWFAVTLPFFYLAFYLAFRFCKNIKISILLTCLFVLAYTVLGTCINHNSWWMCGEWWYNSVHLFSIGLIYAYFEDKIVPFIKKFYGVLLISSGFLSFTSYMYSEYAQGVFSYYGENFNASDTILRRWGCLSSQMLASFFILFFIYLLGLKIKIGNKALAFMGSITLEFYLFHGVFIELFGFSFIDVAPSIYYIKNVAPFLLVVLIPSIPLSWLLQKLLKSIVNLVTRKKAK